MATRKRTAISGHRSPRDEDAREYHLEPSGKAKPDRSAAALFSLSRLVTLAAHMEEMVEDLADRAEAEGLTDEERAELEEACESHEDLPLDPNPTPALPGSPEKIAVMEWRVANGYRPTCPLDLTRDRLNLRNGLVPDGDGFCAVTQGPRGEVRRAARSPAR